MPDDTFAAFVRALVAHCDDLFPGHAPLYVKVDLHGLPAAYGIPIDPALVARLRARAAEGTPAPPRSRARPQGPG